MFANFYLTHLNPLTYESLTHNQCNKDSYLEILTITNIFILFHQTFNFSMQLYGVSINNVLIPGYSAKK